MRKPLLCLISLAAIGCAKPAFQTSLEDVNKGIVKKTEKPICEVDPTDFVLHPKIIAYDITSTSGGSFGFNLLSGILKAFDLKFEAETGEIEVATSIYSPMNYRSDISPDENPALVIGDQRAKSSKGEFKFNIDLKEFNVGTEYYWSTPFSKLTEKGLRASFADALTQLNSSPSRWKTVVADKINEFAIIPVGSLAGIREGDEFVFYNVEYAWEGEPCSKFLMPVPTTRDPIAKGKVVRTELKASAIEIEVLNDQEAVEVGSQVEILKLSQRNPQDKRSLLRSVKIVDMAATPIPVNNSSLKIDFSVYGNIQFRHLLREYGFYVR